MASYVNKQKIINVLRRASYGHEPKNTAKSRQRVAPSTYECEGCFDLIYDGKKDLKDLPEKTLTLGNVRQGKIYMDHIEPVVPVDGYKSGMDHDWNEYIERMFCGPDNFQALCKECHGMKTKEENRARDHKKKYGSKKAKKKSKKKSKKS